MRFFRFKSIVTILLVISLALSPLALTDPVQAKSSDGKGEATLDQQVVSALKKDDYVKVLVKLKDQADTRRAAHLARQQSKGMKTAEQQLRQRQAVVGSLKEMADKTQSDIIAYLQKERRAGHVKDYESFYVVNALQVEADRSVIEALARHPAVAEVQLDRVLKIDLPEPEEVNFSTTDMNGLEWNISRIQADEVWDKLGIDGSGVVVGIIDTGVNWQHEALRDKWRGYNASNPSQSNPKGNWFDAVNGREMPYDEALLPHGTHVLGTILGQDPAGENKIGVAPGAQWIAAKAFNVVGGQLSWLLAAGEFMLAPDGDPALAPDVVNNSWGAFAEVDDWYRDIVKAWRDAGIVPIFAAGNDYYLVSNPANYPESIAVGATDIADKRAPFSNTGPGLYPEAIMKPDLVAPGMYVRSAANNSYDYYDGTSMAAPHVTGVVALLRSADPTLSVDEIASILTETSTPLVDEQFLGVPNYGYGAGLVNAYQAVASVFTPEGLPVIHEPVHGQYVNAESTVVRGEVPEAGTVTVYINDEAQAKVETTNKTFEVEVELQEGRNVITVTLTVEDQEGERSLPVTVLRDTQPPFIQLLDLDDDLMLVAGDHLTLSFMTDSDLVRAELVLADRHHAVDPLPFVEVHPGFYQVEWTVPKGTALSFAEAIVVTEDRAGNTAESIAQGTVTVVSEDNRMERLSGANRYATAVEISQTGWRSADTVVIARGDHYADALAGITLAYQYDAPVLLTERKRLPDLVAKEVERLGAQQAIILGGEQAVGKEVAETLSEMGLQVERLAGANRFETAAEIARSVAPLGVEQAVIVNGDSFADALSAGAYAAQSRWPILLTPTKKLAEETLATLSDLGVEHVTLIGGEQVIAKQVADQLVAQDLTVKRLAGSSRYETSVNVSKHFRPYFGHLYVTTGEDYADALTGAVLAAKRKTGLILVEQRRLPETVKQFVSGYPIMKLDILGGEQAVSIGVEEALSKRLLRY